MMTKINNQTETCQDGRRRLLRCLAAWMVPGASLAQSRSLLLGVVPYLTTRRLVEIYEPLRQFYERELGRSVTLETAPSYVIYYARCAAGEYDLLATSPALGRIAEREQGYWPLARPLTDLEPLLVVLKDSPLREVKDLRGKVVTVSDTLATLTLAARRYLAEMGLPPGSALTVRAMGTHVNSLAALVHGESSAAVISVTALKQMGVDWGDRIRVLARIPPTPPLLYMVHRRLGTETIDRLQRQLLRFANETSEGQDLFRRLAHDGLKPVTAADLAALDSFAQDIKRLLEAL